MNKISNSAHTIPNLAYHEELPNIEKPTLVEFAVDLHKAERAGRHYDIRFQSPADKEKVYSFATKDRFPMPGESITVFMQPMHDMDALDFSGDIKSGYGKGKINKARREIGEVLESSEKKLKLNLYPGRSTEELNFIKIDEGVYKLINSTPSRLNGYALPIDKPKLKSIDLEDLDLNREQYMSPEINGAHGVVKLDKRKPIRVFSYRQAKTGNTDIIEHTFKIDGLRNLIRTPDELAGTQFRAEIFAIDEDGNAVEPEVVAGLLNSNVLKSRNKQVSDKIRLQLAPILLDLYRGKNPPTNKGDEIDILNEIVNILPESVVSLPFVIDPKEKKKMLMDIANGEEPLTREGVVIDGKYKVKFMKEYDVEIKDILPPKARDNMSSGFIYDMIDGKKIQFPGKVGTGFSYALKREMREHPDRFKGVVAVVGGEKISDNGIIQKPVFKGFHLDKNVELTIENFR
ncbi:MAG: hypothetical protein H8D45_32680 [Bacteroidetes bacterium]|nr:hypothetical protein [Bacteroidota bacterium]